MKAHYLRQLMKEYNNKISTQNITETSKPKAPVSEYSKQDNQTNEEYSQMLNEKLDKKANLAYSQLEEQARQGFGHITIAKYTEHDRKQWNLVNGEINCSVCGNLKRWAEQTNKSKKFDVQVEFDFETEDDIYDDLGYKYADHHSSEPNCSVKFKW